MRTYLKILATVLALLVGTLFLPIVVSAARTDALWDFGNGGSFISPNPLSGGVDVLIKGLNHYLNFGSSSGVNGYGIRDNSGAIEFKNSGGSWTGIGTGGGGSGAAYPFPLTGNATSTLTQFNGGLTAYGTSTIGDGTQAGGLTISGGATTTGNGYFAGNVSVNTNSTAGDRVSIYDASTPFAIQYDPTNFRNIRAQIIEGGNTGGKLTEGGFQFIAQGANNSTLGSGAFHFLTPTSNSASSLIDATLTDRVTILQNGNVGIGTIAPGQGLQVNGLEGSFTGLTAQATNANGLMLWGGTNGGTVYGRGDNSGGDDNLVLQGLTGIIFKTLPSGVTTQQAIITNAGLFGIGTTSPYAKLSVHANNGDTNQTLFAIGSSTATATTTLFSVSNTGAVVSSPSSNTSGFIIDGTTFNVDTTNHRIGVGIAAPIYPVQINQSDGVVALDLSSVGNFQGVSTGMLFSFNSGNATANIASIFAQLVNPNTPSLIYRLGTGASSALQEYARLNQNGYGLATSSPYARMSIHANPNDKQIDTTLFAIGSSTATATTTLFSVSNIGSTTIGNFGACSSTRALTTDSNGTITCGTITGSGGGTQAVATSSVESATQVAVFSSTAGTPALIGGNANFSWSSDTLFLNSAASQTNLILGRFNNNTVFNFGYDSSKNGRLLVLDNAANTNVSLSSAATSTFTYGLSADTFRASSTTASSTFSNGLNITKGCFSILGVCLPSVNSSRVKYVVSATPGYGTDTDFQSALDKCATNPGTILLIDSTFTATAQYKFKGNDCYIDLGDNTINWNGGSFPTLFSTNSAAAKYQHIGVFHGNITQTNATWQGTVMDASNMAYVNFSNLDLLNIMTAYKANDTQNTTFYGISENVTVFNTSTSTRAIILNASSTNPWNFNEFDNWRIACDAHCDAVLVDNSKNVIMREFSVEPSSNVDTNGFRLQSSALASDGGILNLLIDNPDVEGNAWGIRNSTTTASNAPIMGTQVRGGYFGTNAQADVFQGGAQQNFDLGPSYNSVASTLVSNTAPFLDINVDGGFLRSGLTISDNTINAQNNDFFRIFAKNGTDAGNGAYISYAGSGQGLRILASTTAASTTGAWYMQGLGAASASANVLCRITTTGQIVLGTGATTCAPSSIDFKRDVVTSGIGLTTLMQLRPVTFFFKENGKAQIGLIAQEADKVDTRLTDKNLDGSVATINWGDVDAVLIKSVQDQQHEIDAFGNGAKRSAEENWQWLAIGLLVVWNIGLTLRRRK